MNTNVKFGAIALAAALVGGSAGATLTSWKSDAATAPVQPAPVAVQPAPQVDTATTAPESQPVVDENAVAAEPVDAAAPAQPRTYVASTRPAAAPARSVSTGRSSNSRRVYYDYGQPRASSAPSAYTYRQDRSFWDKHRDKLSTAIGAGSGALLGGLIGGKKGAGWGAIAGGAGTALWTYKIRKRNNY